MTKIREIDVVKFRKNIAAALIAKRLAGEYTYRKMEKDIGVSRNTIYRWEEGKNPSFSNGIMVCRYLNIDLEEIIELSLQGDE